MQGLGDPLVGHVADHEHGGQLTGGREIDQLPVVFRIAHLVVPGGHVHPVIFQQAAVAHQHPPAAHPAGQAHILLINQAVHGGKNIGLILDDPAENSGQRTARLDRNGGRVQNRLVNAGAGEGLDAVEQHALAREQVGRVHHHGVQVAELFDRVPAADHAAPAQGLFSGPQ